MQLSDIIQSAKYKIVDGSEYLWNCFGNNTRILDFSGFESEQNSGVSCMFDSKTQQVYEVNIYTNNDKWYRWIDEEYIEKYKEECASRNISFSISSDDSTWVDLDNIQDVYRKVEQVIETGNCDNEVTIEIDIENDLLLKLSLMAHKRNITLNDLFKEILEDAVNRAEEIIKNNTKKED